MNVGDDATEAPMSEILETFSTGGGSVAKEEIGNDIATPVPVGRPAESSSPRKGEAPNEERIVASNRWRSEGRDMEVAVFRDRARAIYEKARPGCKRREAHDYAWKAAIAAFPPEGKKARVIMPEPADKHNGKAVDKSAEVLSGQLQGLEKIPDTWGELPTNASQQAELGWVQANRLAMIEQKPSGATRVHLDKARAPAPSLAALGWLETSIRSYAKYVDVVARVLKDDQDEAEEVRRERIAQNDIAALLHEMDKP